MTLVVAVGAPCYRPFSLEQVLRGVAEAGMRNVELCGADELHEELDAHRLAPTIARTRSLLEEFGLRCLSLSARAELHSRHGLAVVRQILVFGAQSGTEIVSVAADIPHGPSEWDSFCVNTRLLADIAQSVGVQLCLECGAPSIPTAAQGVKLLDEIGGNIKINYDPAEVAFYDGGSVSSDLEYALPRLGHVHLKDKKGGKGVASFPPLGEGDLDIAAVVGRLDSAGFAGPVSLQVVFEDDVWPNWHECQRAIARAKRYWDSLVEESPGKP